MRKINKLVIHCSDSEFGSAGLIDAWHKERGFKKIGYHYVLLNGYSNAEFFKKKQRRNFLDGSIECGRDEQEEGAHVEGHNSDSLGICLIGKAGNYTPHQFYNMRELIKELLNNYNLTPAGVLGHYELDSKKTCPDINMEHLREYIMDFNKINLLLANYWEKLAGNFSEL